MRILPAVFLIVPCAVLLLCPALASFEKIATKRNLLGLWIKLAQGPLRCRSP